MESVKNRGRNLSAWQMKKTRIHTYIVNIHFMFLNVSHIIHDTSFDEFHKQNTMCRIPPVNLWHLEKKTWIYLI